MPCIESDAIIHRSLERMRDGGNMDKKQVLVCITSSPTGQKLIKIAKRLAVSRGNDLQVVHAQKQGTDEIIDAALKDSLEYAKSINAKIVILQGKHPAEEIAAYVHTVELDKLIIGKTAEKGLFSNRFYRQLRKRLPQADIITIPQPQNEYDPEYSDSPLETSWRDIGIMFGILILATLISWWFHLLGFTDATLITVYILAVLLVSFLTSGFVCSTVSSVLSVLTFNFLFTVPLFSLRSYGSGYPVTLVIMFLAAFLTSSLTAQVKRQAQQHAQNAYRTEMLLNANHRLQMATGETSILREAAGQIQKLLVRSVLIYPVRNGVLEDPLCAAAGETEEELIRTGDLADEHAIAQWVADNNTQAGAATGIFNESAFWYLSVRLNDDTVCAVTAIRVEAGESIDAFDKNLMLAILAECSVAIEKERLNQRNEAYAVQMKQERLRSDLLHSISHDLRTPLTTISGNASLLMENTVKDEKEKQRIYSDIYDDSVWLMGLVENLLSITRMDNGSLKINREAQDLSDIVDAALAHAAPRLKNAKVNVDKGKDLAIVNADSSLLVQMLDNLIDNAVKYAGSSCRLDISIRTQGTDCILRIADDGPGVADADKEKVFDMFYTAQKQKTVDGRRGLGLGLALCREIVQAHNGTIAIKDAEPHGAVFEAVLPAMEDRIYE